jgi:hypothetical protein
VEKVSLLANQDVDPGAGKVPPFGYPERSGNPVRESLKLSAVSQYGSPSELYALTDADQKNSPTTDNPWFGQLPRNPIHGHYRQGLYFDWHVSAQRAP